MAPTRNQVLPHFSLAQHQKTGNLAKTRTVTATPWSGSPWSATSPGTRSRRRPGSLPDASKATWRLLQGWPRLCRCWGPIRGSSVRLEPRTFPSLSAMWSPRFRRFLWLLRGLRPGRSRCRSAAPGEPSSSRSMSRTTKKIWRQTIVKRHWLIKVCYGLNDKGLSGTWRFELTQPFLSILWWDPLRPCWIACSDLSREAGCPVKLQTGVSTASHTSN